MELQSITTQNFGKLGSVHVELAGSRVHLFCGPNESGKSTLSEAVRFALRGESPRIELKKDYDKLVSDGHSKGRVTLGYLGSRGAVLQSMFRDVHTNGSVTKDFKFDELTAACLDIALQARTFASADAKERRKLLTNLLDIKMTPDAIGERLKTEHGIEEKYVTTVKPLLRGGFEAAHKVAKDEMSKARGAWEAATGESFGTVKAVEWKPKDPPEPVTDEAMKAAQDVLAAAEAVVESTVADIATLRGGAKAIDSLNSQRESLVKLKAEERQVRNQRAQKQIGLSTSRSEIGELEQQLDWANKAKEILVCPNCDSRLHMKEGLLQPVAVTELETVGDRGNTAEGGREDFVKGIAALQAKIRADEAGLAQLSAKLERIVGADTLIAEIDEKLGQLGANAAARDEKIAQLEATLQEARKVVDEERLARDQLRDKVSLVRAHEGKVRQAQAASAAFFAWSKVADALGPEGLPAKLLAEALKPINMRLEASAALAGWPRVQLNNEVELVRYTKDEPDRAISMLSESAQWRACAIMADAISSLSQLKLLILDRADVLDLPGRTQLFNWLARLAEDEYDTILVFATLKAPPTPEQVGGARVHWLPDIVKNQSKPEKRNAG
jgi:energy-coupling factor transporter ATP-binding protein EcfA2